MMMFLIGSLGFGIVVTSAAILVGRTFKGVDPRLFVSLVFGLYSLPFLAISILYKARYERKLLLQADRDAANMAGREAFVAVLAKVESHLHDQQDRSQNLLGKLLMKKPNLEERLRNLQRA